MKKFLIFLTALSCAAGWAQLPSLNTSLSLEVKSVGSGGATSVRQGVAVGIPLTITSAPGAAATQSHESKTRLEVKLRNLGTSPASARLEWYFVAREVHNVNSSHPGAEYVWDQGKRDISLTAASEDHEMLESTGVTQTLAQSSTAPTSSYQNGQLVTTLGSASNSRTGSRPEGWIVRMMDGDRLLRIQASSNDLEVIGSDPARLLKLIGSKPRVPMTTRPGFPVGPNGQPLGPNGLPLGPN